ncbi:Rib/alpha-like domain-containing protein [Gardnerella vaginalis]|uniref:Rib/alpha-like domain-containing protein n=1 Tax=Gardnerella vaginalis TaxID=2702 RepID=UPI0039EFD7C9
MLPAGLRGFASRMGRFASRAFAWNKGGADSCAAAVTSDSDSLSSAAASTDARISATTAARTARSARTLLRALFAMLLAAATLLAMLVLPPVNMAFADEGARWDYGGTGYISGKGFDWADSTRDLNISYPRLWTGQDGKKKITWTVTFNKNSYLLAHIRGGTLRVKDKNGYKNLVIEPHSSYAGHSDVPPEGAGFSGSKPLFMVFLPKGINNVNIDRRRTGRDALGGNGKFARWPYEYGKGGKDLKKWYKTYPEDVVADKLIQCSDGYECKDPAERDRKTQEFLNESWEESWRKLTLIKNNGVKKSSWSCQNGKIDYNQSIASFAGPSNWNKYNGAHYDSGDGFDTFWNEALGEKRLGSGECIGESCRGYSLAEIKQWKSKFQVVLASWEQNDYSLAMEWKITGDYDESIKNPELLPLIAGWNSNKTKGNYGDPFPGKKDEWQSKWSFIGPYDTDGDGIPDLSEFYLGTDPTKKTNILYPVYKSKMLSDYPKRGAKNPTDYGGTDNVPVTTYKEPITVKPFVNVGTWVSNTFDPNLFHQDKNADGTNATSTDLHHAIDLPGAENTAYLNMSYAITGVPDNGVTNNNWQGCDTNTKDGCVKIDPKTGYITYRPRKDDWKKYPDGLEFKVKVTHINPNIYPYNSDKNKGQAWEEKDVPVKIKVLSNASLYNPHYDETTVNYDKDNNRFNPTDSAEPKSVKTSKKPWVREGALPSGSTFKLEKYTQYTSPVLDWSKIDSKNTGNGKVTFSPSKTEAGTSDKTPVLVTYPDGSTSKDSDAGNYDKVVYAPVKVQELPVNDGDLHLDLKDGTQINNGQFGGWSFGDANNPKELSKTTKIGGPKENKNNGIVLDSWSTNAKGPITFRAVCHKKNDTKYKLLKPAEGNSKASGDINGLQFEEFRQWIRDNDKKCKVKGANCSDDNHYLHPGEYNKDTMERSRALIGGKPKEGGEYECKVFAFHQAHDGKGTQHNGALTKFDQLAKDNGAGFVFAFDTGAFASSRGKEWVSGNFYFKIKLKDSQKYNPTYKTIPTIQAGTFANKEANSSGQPKSHTKITVNGKQVNANGVPDDDLGGVEDGKALPPGTWFEIKKLVKKVDKTQPDKFPSEKELWSNFEGGEDNVKRDNSGKSVMEKGKVVPLNETGREYGSVTFRPDKWKDAGQYWAEVVVHYPDGSASSDDDSINYKHPVYAKVNVTRDDKDNQLHLNLYKHYFDIGMDNGYDLKVGKSLPNDATFDSWMTKSVGKLHQHVICSKKGKDGKYSDYTYNTLPGHVNKKDKDEEKDGLRFKSQKIWEHASFKQQKQCRLDKRCDKDNYLYDRDGASEQTRGYFGGKAQKTGDYQCKVYVISGKDKSEAFANAVKANIKKSTSKDPAAGLFDKTKDNKYPYGEDSKGYKIGSFDIRIHNDNHFYNPKYVDVSVTAGQKVENVVPKSVKNANGANEYQDDVKAGALPDGTWFEFKDSAKGFEVNGDGTKGKQVSLDWSYWAGNAADKAGDQSNKPDNPKDPNNHKGKHSANGDGARYGKVTFHPDQSVAPKAYFKEIVIHYPDGSTSDNPDSGNNGKPVYAKVTVRGLSGADKDLKMTLLRSQDADPIHDTLGSANPLTVMSGTSLTKNPYVLAWSLKDRSNISLRMMCTKQGEQKWSRGLEDTLNMHLNQDYGNGVKPWAFATADQRKSCSQDSKNCKANLLYGFTKNGKQDSIESAVSRSEDDIAGVPQKAGKYTCAVFALKPNALAAFDNTVNNGLSADKKYSSTNMKTVQLGNLSPAVDWNRISFDVNVIDPPKFALPKTGGMNWNMLMSVVCVLGTGAMAAGFFLDQTKWGRAMLEALLRKALIKSFIRKTAERCGGVMLRIEWWITERWRC